MENSYCRKKFGFNIYLIAVIAAFAGLLFGLDMGIISGALPFIKKHFMLETTTQEVVVSSLMLGCVVGVFMIRPISHRWGRKTSLIICGSLFIVASLGSGFAINVDMLIVSRFVIGISVGIASFATPIYISEIAPKQIRGGMIAVFQFLIVLGVAIAFLIDTALTPYGAWRFMLGILCVPGGIMLLGILFLPKSPRWLMLHNREKDARNVLCKLGRSADEVESEIDEIIGSLNETQEGWKLLKDRRFNKVLLLGIALQFFQQLCGWNALLYYAPTVFDAMGFRTAVSRIWVAFLVLGLFHVLATLLPIFLNDKLGRRKLLFIGVGINIVSMLMLGALFFIGMGLADWMKYLAVALLLLFNIGYSISLGPVVWTLCSEIFPLKGRDIGMMTATAANWIGSFIIAQLTLTIIHNAGPGWTFMIFAIIGVATVIFTYFFVPETKGVPLEEIEEGLMMGRKLRNIGIVLKKAK